VDRLLAISETKQQVGEALSDRSSDRCSGGRPLDAFCPISSFPQTENGLLSGARLALLPPAWQDAG
jgi:hypothetical protein